MSAHGAKHPSVLTELQLSETIMSQMTGWIDENSFDLNRYFTNRALPLLLQQIDKKAYYTRIDKKTYYNLLTSFAKSMLLDTNSIIDMIAADLKEKDNYRHFGDLNIHKQLTLKQLDKLKSSWGVNISDTTRFLGCYIKQLSPLFMQRYEGKKWDDIPLNLKERYLNTLYEYAIDKVTSPNSGHYSCRAYICWHYMYFMEQIYGIYDIESIIEYLTLPKYSSYMRPDDGGFFKALKNVVTGQPYANVGESFDFLTAYKGIPTWNQNEDEQFMKRFLLRIFQYPSMWTTFLSLKSNQIRSSKAKGYRKKKPMNVFKEWMDDKWLQQIEAEAILYSGDTSKTNKCIKILSERYGKYYYENFNDDTYYCLYIIRAR